MTDYKEKTRKTCLKKYGVEHYAQTEECKEKSKKTCLEKYNVKYSSQSEIVKEKSKKTCIEKYGVNNPARASDYKEKTRKTCLQKYGKKYYSQTNRYLSKFKPLYIQKLKDSGYYNVGYRVISYKGNSDYEVYCPHCKQNFIISNINYYNRHLANQEICTNCNPLIKFYSYGEKEVLSYISSIYDGVILENDRSVIHPYELDIYLPDLRLAVEYNGDYWHANPKYYSEDHIIGEVSAKEVRKKDKQKINCCIKAGIELLVIWEDDWINRQDVVKQELLDIITELLEKRVNS